MRMTATRGVKCGGRHIRAGEDFECPDEDAARLMALGAARVAVESEPEPEEEPEASGPDEPTPRRGRKK